MQDKLEQYIIEAVKKYKYDVPEWITEKELVDNVKELIKNSVKS